MTVNPSPERISDLIGGIYDCVLQPKKWEVALGAICGELNFLHSVLGYYETPTGNPLLRLQYGLAQEWFDKMPEYGPDMAAFWGGAERIRAYPLGEVIVHSIAGPEVDVRRNRFAREWCAPQGIADFAALTLSVDPERLSSLVFTSEQKLGSEHELELLRLLAPHMRRAVTISRLFDMKTIEAASFASVLEGFAFGLVLIDERLGIVHANAAARAMLAASDPIRSEKGMLTLPARVAHAALERAVHQVATDALGLGQRGIGIPARRSEGEACVIHVLPLRGGEIQRGLVQRAAAAIFVAPATAPSRAPTDALALLYDLTPAETRIFELLTTGMTQAAIGEALGIAASTVKTHVLHLFEKTGCQRQADLLKLAATLSLPV